MMGSKVEPYFILTAEKVRNPKELKELSTKQIDTVVQDNLPRTPPPSGVSGNTGVDIVLNTIPKTKKKGFVKYKIPVKEFRKKEKLSKKMELIKEKLEKSRERFNELKRSKGEVDLKCEPNGTNVNGDIYANPFKLERSVSDITHTMTSTKKHETSSPYVYFVVTEEENEEENDGKVVSKSAGKRRRLRIVEENRLKRDRIERLNPSAKKCGIARELGLKSNILVKDESRQGNPNKPSVSHIVFQGQENEPPLRSKRQASSKVLRTIHSPPRIPPGTPATMLTNQSGEKHEPTTDADENVPRKPFLSGPLYTGKNRGMHAFSLQHFELPEITPEQKRRALGMSSKFDEFAYPKPQSEQRQRKVSFADQLPVVKGSGFALSSSEIRESLGFEIPTLGPRAVTMGSITLPSERLDKQSVCQKYLAGENMSSARTLRKFGVPLPLPKIDIVSNVYDEMIIKMITEYLQDTNTPSRQSQLAKELLVHLQKHNENMKELNVPNLNKKNKSKLNKDDIIRHQKRAQQLLNDINFPAPPNTAEETEPKVMDPCLRSVDMLETSPPDVPEFEETKDKPEETNTENQRNIPFVQITFKPKGGETEPEVNDHSLTGDNVASDNQIRSNSKSTVNEKRPNSRPILSAVTPVSFQMAPPGLERDESFVSVPFKSNSFVKT